MKTFWRKWWIDRDGKEFRCTKGTEEVPDDLHLGGAMELWGCNTEDALKKGMLRVVRYDNEMYFQNYVLLTRKQRSTLRDLAIEENCTLIRA